MSQYCPQLEKVSEQVRAFWETRQTECADTLLRFSYAALLTPAGYIMTEKAGLLYLMQHALWFEDFPKSSMFNFLYQGAAPYEKTRLQMPLTNITACRIISRMELEPLLSGTPSPRTGWWQQFLDMFKPAASYLLISGTDATGSVFQSVFRDLDAPESWAQAVTDLL
jgi:hypothetical protein